MLYKVTFGNIPLEVVANDFRAAGIPYTIFPVQGWTPQFGSEPGVRVEVMLAVEQGPELLPKLQTTIAQLLKAHDEKSAMFEEASGVSGLYFAAPPEGSEFEDDGRGYAENYNYPICPGCHNRHVTADQLGKLAELVGSRQKASRDPILEALQTAGKPGRREDN